MPKNEIDFQIIANLMSGKGETLKTLNNLICFLDNNNLTYDLLKIEKPSPISLLPAGKSKIKKGVVCIGGDGTVSETIGYILNNKLNCPLSIIPTGTANFIATAFKVMGSTSDFRFLLEKRIKKVDVGSADYGERKNYFMLGLGLGFEENFLKLTKEKYKTRLGIFSYILSALSELMSLKKIPLLLNIDGKEKNINVCTLMVLNTPPRILNIFPLFQFNSIAENNGTLSLQYVEYINYFHAFLGTLALHILGNINFGTVKSVDFKHLLISSNEVIGTQIDGELKGNLPTEIKVLPSSFEFWI